MRCQPLGAGVQEEFPGLLGERPVCWVFHNVGSILWALEDERQWFLLLPRHMEIPASHDFMGLYGPDNRVTLVKWFPGEVPVKIPTQLITTQKDGAATRGRLTQAEAGSLSCSPSLTAFSALKARQERGREKPHYREEGRQKACSHARACL